MLTAPGSPYIYYGEELGIYGTKANGDEYVRSPMLWGDSYTTSYTSKVDPSVASQVKRLQDKKTGLWYQVLDRSGDEGNYLESSCSTMFVYTLYKAVRKGYIDRSYLKVAEKGYKGILKHFIEVDENGLVTITKACAVAGLGGTPYRSGDYDYYINEKIRDNDPKAAAPFILASLEREALEGVEFDCAGK